MPAVAAARGWAQELHDRRRAVGTADQVELLIVGPGRTYSPREVTDVLHLPVRATLPWDPDTAQDIHLGRATRRLKSGPLARALRPAAADVAAAAAANRSRTALTRQGTR